MDYRIFNTRDNIPQTFLKALYYLEHKYHPELPEGEYFCIREDGEYCLDIDFSDIVFLIRERQVIGYYIVLYCGKKKFVDIAKEYVGKLKISGKRFCIICDFVIDKDYIIYFKAAYNNLFIRKNIDMVFANYKLSTSYPAYKKYVSRKIFDEVITPVIKNGYAHVIFKVNYEYFITL